MSWTSEDFVADHVALDFLNTVSNIDKGRDQNRLLNWDVALEWGGFAEILTAQEIGELSGLRDREEAFARLLEFRELAFDLLHARAQKASPSQASRSLLEAEIRQAHEAGHMGGVESGFRWQNELARSGGELLRHRLALGLWELMSGPDFIRLRECGRCSWLFLNRGRGVGRRWCRMSACGNRAKAAAYRANHDGPG